MIEAMLTAGGKAPPGEAIFTTPGTHSFKVPPGINSLSMVAVGAGEGDYSRGGRGGGALVYANNVPVSPGDLIEVTVGTDGDDTVVAGTITAAGAVRYSGGERSGGGDGGGDGGRGGYYSSGYGGGGGAAGRYDRPGGDGARAESYSYQEAFWAHYHSSSDWRSEPFDEIVDGSGSYGENGLPSASSKPFGYDICVRTGSSGSYYYYWHTRGERDKTGYRTRSGTPNGTNGQGRGGSARQDGEGVGLIGLNDTPGDNGYGYGGGRNRPGGQGAARIIWGDDRAFPSQNATQASSVTIETY